MGGEIYSIGYCAQLTQRSPRELFELFLQNGIEPYCRINGVVHYQVRDVEAVLTKLREEQPANG